MCVCIHACVCGWGGGGARVCARARAPASMRVCALGGCLHKRGGGGSAGLNVAGHRSAGCWAPLNILLAQGGS